MNNLLANKPKSSQEMATILSQNLKSLFKEKDINFAYLGGSWAKEKNNWWSDLDIFVSVPKYITFNAKEKLKYKTDFSKKITEILKIEEVDLEVVEILPLHVQYDVISNGILLYEKMMGLNVSFIERFLPFYYDHMIWYKNLIHQSDSSLK